MDETFAKSGRTSSTLAELTSHLAQNAVANANLAIVSEISGLTFTDSSTNGLQHALSKRLLVGTDEAHSGGVQHVWAHVHSRSNIEVEDIRNHVTHCSEDGIQRNSNTLKDLNLVEPFKFIGNMADAKGPKKMRNLILFFFLTEGYLEGVHFSLDSIGHFTKACKGIATAWNALKLLPSTSLTPPESVPVPSSVLEDLKSEGEVGKPTDVKPSDTDQEPYVQNTTTSTPLKRSRELTESITDGARK
jgi:hypothetical protein